MLAAAVPARPGDTVLELGCGSGAAFLCLLARCPSLRVTAVERQPVLAALAENNVATNGHAGRVQVRAGDIAAPATMAGLSGLDHAMANPPWWPDGTAPPDPGRAAATHLSGGVGLDTWVGVLASPLRHGGSATVIVPATLLEQALSAMKAAGLGGLVVYPLWPRAGTEAKRLILSGRRGSRGLTRVLPGLVLHDGPRWTAAAEAVLRDAGALPDHWCAGRQRDRAARPGSALGVGMAEQP